MLTGDLFQPLTEKKKKPKPTKPDKWAYAKAQAKKKFDVYPSAYANAWAAKKYKELGGGWRMGEDAVEEAEGQQSDAPSKTYANQKLVNIMRKAAEVPGTGMTNDQRMFVAMYDELEDAVEKIGDVEKQNQELRRQVAKQAAPAAKAAEPAKGKEEPAKEPTAAQVKAQPAPEPTVQKVVQNITQVLQRAEQSAETPEQQKEIQVAKDRIADLEDKMDQLSNADVKEIERTFVEIEKGGIKMGDVKRLLRVVDKRIEQSAKEKQAAEKPITVDQPEPEKPITVDQPKPGEISTNALRDFMATTNDRIDANDKKDAAQDANIGAVAGDTVKALNNVRYLNNIVKQIKPDEVQVDTDAEIPTQPKAQEPPVPGFKRSGTYGESLNEQNEETFDFRLPAARLVGVLDDFFATNWNNAFRYFEKTYHDEENEEEEDPWGESLSQLENTFLVPATVIKKLNTLTTSIIDLEDYHSQIYNHPEYGGMFGQVMFPAFKGKIYNRAVKSAETDQMFDNDLQFFDYYNKALANAVKTKIHPFMRNIKDFVQKEYSENQEDNHAMMQYFARSIWGPYKLALDNLSNAVKKLKPLTQKMSMSLQPATPEPGKQGELFERKKKKKKSKSKKAFGGYYFPGYHYYGQGTAEISDGGGDGGGESMFEVVTKNRTPEETGALDSYYSRRRQPHKVVDGKRVELTDREEIQQYLDAYENETDRKDYGDMSEQRLYFRTVATLAESLEHDFGMQKDDKGWYLTPRSGRQRILDAERAFGTPQVKR